MRKTGACLPCWVISTSSNKFVRQTYFSPMYCRDENSYMQEAVMMIWASNIVLLYTKLNLLSMTLLSSRSFAFTVYQRLLSFMFNICHRNFKKKKNTWKGTCLPTATNSPKKARAKAAIFYKQFIFNTQILVIIQVQCKIVLKKFWWNANPEACYIGLSFFHTSFPFFTATEKPTAVCSPSQGQPSHKLFRKGAYS